MTGTIDGRVSLDYFENFEPPYNYSFKGHRVPIESEAIMKAYAVNDFAFMPKIEGQSTKFVTCGSDGYIKMWDAEKKKRLW